MDTNNSYEIFAKKIKIKGLKICALKHNKSGAAFFSRGDLFCQAEQLFRMIDGFDQSNHLKEIFIINHFSILAYWQVPYYCDFWS